MTAGGSEGVTIGGVSGGVTMVCVSEGCDEDDRTTKMGCGGKDGTNGGGKKDDENEALGDVVDELRGVKEDEVVAKY